MGIAVAINPDREERREWLGQLPAHPSPEFQLSRKLSWAPDIGL